MFAAKQYQQSGQRLLAACDAELLGQSFSQGKFRLDVPASFYDDVRVDEGGLEGYLRGCTVANLVGPKAVETAIRMGLVARENVLVVDGVPHAQLLVVEP